MIIGLDKLEAKLNDIAVQDLKRPTDQAILLVQADAKSNVSVDSGELRESIYTDTAVHGDRVEAVCFTNKEWAQYVEFGTGPVGQAEHAGISPDAAVAYTQQPWWIHESQVDRETAEKYHWFAVKTKDGIFYQCSGQPARPYLYPAMKNNADNIRGIYESHLADAIRRNTR